MEENDEINCLIFFSFEIFKIINDATCYNSLSIRFYIQFFFFLTVKTNL